MSVFLHALLATAVIAILIMLRLLADRLILRSRRGQKFGTSNCQPVACDRDCHKPDPTVLQSHNANLKRPGSAGNAP